MKFIIATSLVVSIVAMASMAQAGDYKSTRDCTYQTQWPSSQCGTCCEQFGQIGVQGRHAFVPSANNHLCECITKEEQEKREAEDAEKAKLEPRYKSIGQCSDFVGPSSPCTDCCATFDHVGVEGRHSLLPGADFHVCKCITKDEDKKRDAEFNAQWQKEQRAKGRLE